jgi:hypothetical protein
MSTTNTSNTPSRSAQPRHNSTGYAARGASRYASAASSSGQEPVITTTTRARQDIEVQGRTSKPLPREYANTLSALTGWLTELNDPEYELNADDVIGFFDALKAAEKSEALPNVIRHYPQEPGLPKFVNGLTAFLGRLDRDMEHADKLLWRGSEQTDHDDLHYAELQELLSESDNPQPFNLFGLAAGPLRTICLGLAACASPHAPMPFSVKQFVKASKAVQQITDKILRLVHMAGLPDAGKSISVVLDITNWITRGSKAGLLVPSATIKDMVPRFLDAFLTWAPTPGVDTPLEGAGSVQNGRTADAFQQNRKEPHQIGKCAVQIMPIYQNGLIGLDPAGCGALQQLALNLCSDAFLKQVEKPPVQGVAVINLTNMIKDCMEAGLLSLAEPRLPAILKGLLELISKIPASEMVMDGGRTLANASNFLRVLIEHTLREPDTFPAVARTAFNAACNHVVACTNAGTHLYEQSTTNLLSFMKALDKWIELPEFSERKEWNRLQPGALDAAGRLIKQAIVLGGACFTAQEALGGILSALAYFMQRRLDMPHMLKEFLHELMESVAAPRQAAWGQQGRGQVLLAMEVLAKMEILRVDDMQDALTALLGPCQAVSGVYGLPDLSAAVSRLGPIRDVVMALPPRPDRGPEHPLRSPLSAEAISPPPRPGFTPIKVAPVASVAEQNATAKNSPKQVATGNTTASTSTNSTCTTSTSRSNTSTVFIPTPSTQSDANHEIGFKPAKRTARSDRIGTATAMVVTAPVLQTWSADEVGKMSVRTQTAAATQATKQDSSSDPEGDHASTESEPGKAKLQPKARPAGAKGPIKRAVADTEAESRIVKAKPPVTGDAQKSDAIPSRQKWFDQLAAGNVSLVKLQRLAEANPEFLNAKDKLRRTAIFYAVTRGKSSVVNWLMEHEGHRLEGAPKQFLNALFRAATAVSPEMEEAMRAFLHHASEGRYILDRTELQVFLIKSVKRMPWLAPICDSVGLDLTPASDTVPEPVLRPQSRLKSLRALAKVSVHNSRQMLLAVFAGPEAVLDCLSVFRTPNAETLEGGSFALLKALQLGRDEEAEILIKHWDGSFIDQSLIYTPGNLLAVAVEKSSAEVVGLLARHGNGKLLRAEYMRGTCCVAEAIRFGKVQHAKMLIDAMDDARLALCTAGGYNALWLAAHDGNQQIARLLLDRAPGLATEAAKIGGTPLDVARELNHPGVVELLTKHAEKFAVAGTRPIASVTPAIATPMEKLPM